MKGQLLLVTLPLLLFGAMMAVFFKHEGKAETCGEASPDRVIYPRLLVLGENNLLFV